MRKTLKFISNENQERNLHSVEKKNTRMKLAVNAILVLLIAGLGYVLFSSIREPITFKGQLDNRTDAVKERLIQIRTAQESYRSITGEFAPTFDTLKHILNTGKFAQVSIESDPSDPNNEDKYIYDTTFLSAIDSIEAMGIVLDGLEDVPFSSDAKFTIFADTITYQIHRLDATAGISSRILRVAPTRAGRPFFFREGIMASGTGGSGSGNRRLPSGSPQKTEDMRSHCIHCFVSSSCSVFVVFLFAMIGVRINYFI